jgi:cysteine-rich repeat protein
MAPELFDGQPATASSDQFSFCVALFQALQGAHPYLDPTLSAPRLDDLIAATKAGALRAGPRDAALPAGLRRALRRGLAHEAGRRYPSLRALLQDLEACLEGERPAVGPVRRRRALTAAAAVVLLPAAFVAARALLRPAAIAGPRCGDGVVDRGEECDDGNADDADGCTIGCLRCAGGDDRFSASDGHCYSRHAAVASWSDAQASCTRIGGHLVAYHDAAEIAAVSERLVAGRGDSFWIGLSDVAGTGAFAWVTGDALDPSLGWVERHAQGACVWQSGRARIGAQALTWIPADCSKRLAYVCEQDGHFKAF